MMFQVGGYICFVLGEVYTCVVLGEVYTCVILGEVYTCVVSGGGVHLFCFR